MSKINKILKDLEISGAATPDEVTFIRKACNFAADDAQGVEYAGLDLDEADINAAADLYAEPGRMK